MQLPPPEVAAQWPKPNFVDPETQGPGGTIISLLLATLVTVILAIRIYSRKWLTNGIGLDDTLICLAYFPSLAFVLTGVIAEAQLQFGRHVWDIEPKFFDAGLKISYVLFLLFDLATSLIKLSMLAMVFRLTKASDVRALNWFVLAMVGITTVNCVVFIFVTVFQCRPISAYWTLSLEPQDCIDETAHLLAANVINTLTDFIVVLLPIKVAATLDLPKRQRVIVIGLFAIGLFACAAGVARSYYSWAESTAADFDKTWDAWAVWVSSAVELQLGIICASVPATKPFFASFLPQVIDTTLRARDKETLVWDSRPPTGSVSQTASMGRPPTALRPFALEELAHINELSPSGDNANTSRFSEDSIAPLKPVRTRLSKAGGDRASSALSWRDTKDLESAPMVTGHLSRDRTTGETVFIMYDDVDLDREKA
ncbi:integral membrane protein [Xylariomycetidae sp. FL0641]|nr:integral membrane protein [Xylariomycetidae sp. FL0641]